MDKNILALNRCCPALKHFGMGDWVNEVNSIIGGPMQIRGTWFFVDAKIGTDVNDGLSAASPLPSIASAYARCVDGRGDGIVLLSAGTTTAETTSYLKSQLAWTKSGITVIGVAAPVRMFGRARVANKEVTSTSTTMAQTAHGITRETGSFITDGWIVGMKGSIADSGSNNGATFTVTAVTALELTVSETLNVQSKAQTVSCVLTSYVAALIVVSGSNNTFVGVHFGNFGSNALSVGGVKVTGARNYFGNCHFIGAGHATPAATVSANDIEIAAGQENTFERCTFGTDTIIRAAANGNIMFSGGAWRTQFYDCDILAYSDTAGKGAIISADATALSGVQIFARCRFMLWNDNGIGNLTSAFIGTKPNSGALLMDSCSLVGWAAWDSVAGNDMVYIANSAAVASGGGGIATTV